MIAFLISLAPFLPVILQVVGWLISLFGTSKANLEAYQAMIQKNKDAGLISVETAERLAAFHAQLLADAEARAKADAEKKLKG